jgi:hypothetical protein
MIATDTQDWGVYNWDGEMHVAPVNEIDRHFAVNCPCGTREDEAGVIVHSSYDGREAFERGERKPS